MATTTTWEVLIERIVENLYPRRFPVKVTATGGAVGTFVASTVAYSSHSTNAYDGAWLLILDTTDDAAPEGESSRVTAAGFTVASGSYAISPNWSAAVASGDIGLFCYIFHPDEILDAANDIQRTLYLPVYRILSPLTDGDMETSGTTNWTDVGTCVQTKTTTAAEILTGTQALKLVIPAGITNGVQSASMPVQDNESILVSVCYKTSGANMSVVLYDVTNGAPIKTVTPANSIFTTWVETRFVESVPSGCQNIAIRLMNASATTETTAYVDWVAPYRTQMPTLDLPSAVLDARDPRVVYMPAGLGTDDSDIYNVNLEFAPWPSEPLRDLKAVTSHRITLNSPITYPLFLRYSTTGTVMTGLTSTTEAPQEIILHGALEILLHKLADSTKNMSEKADLVRRAARAGAVYTQLLDDKDMLRPEVRKRQIRRVSVPWD